MSPQEAFEIAKMVDPGCVAIYKTENSRIPFEIRIDWPEGVARWPINIRPYTFHELIQQVANGRDETSFGYIVGLTENCVTFKKNDIGETRTLSDCSDVTWVDGSPFGVSP
jgi:hypothetical protein